MSQRSRLSSTRPLFEQMYLTPLSKAAIRSTQVCIPGQSTDSTIAIPRRGNILTGLQTGLLLCLVACASVAAAQQLDINTNTPQPGTGHNYIQALNEIVNPGTGSVSIRIQTDPPAQRAPVPPLYIYTYDSSGTYALKPYFDTRETGPSPFVSAFSRAGFPGVPNITSYTDNQVTGKSGVCDYGNNYIYVDPTGARHDLNLVWVNTTSNMAVNACQAINQTATLVGGDAVYTAQITDPSNENSVVVWNLHGSQVWPTYRDTNGNASITTGAPFVVNSSSITLPGNRVYKVTGPGANTSGYTSISLNPQISGALVSSCPHAADIPGWQVSKTAVGPTTITLPDLSNYTITDDSQTAGSGNEVFNLIGQIKYPTGATISYQWAIDPQSTTESFAPCVFAVDWPRLKQRTVSFDGKTPALQQTFQYTTTPAGVGWTSKSTTVVTTDLLNPLNGSYKTVYNYVQGLNSLLESSILYYDKNGVVIKTDVKNMDYNSGLLLAECVQLGSGGFNGTFYTYHYFGRASILADVAEYSYGAVQSSCTRPSGNPVRERKTTYHTFEPGPGTPFDIKDRPGSVQTYGNGVLLAETDYAYDEAAVQSVIPAPPLGHDETDYGASSKLPNGDAVPRGNATTTTRKCFVKSTSCANSVTKVVFDETGLPVSVTDANTNMTEYSFTDAYTSDDGTPPGNTHTYLSQITRPSTGGVSHVDNYVWDYDKGELRTHTDENKVVTQYNYIDPWNRLTLTDSAPGTINWATNASAESKAVYTYPSLTQSTEASDQTVTGDGALKSSTTYDGMGHAIKVVGRDGSVVETGYDGSGRACVVSNPTINAPSALSCKVGANITTAVTDGYTYVSYDSLGRKKQQIQPDGAKKIWNYTANLTDFYDEDNSHWQWAYDALGRLVKTLENDPAGSGSLSLETDYTYDALDNLLTLNQKGASGDVPRYRTFNYDSLSRLINACNPESIAGGSTCTSNYGPWSIVYSYDPNGNVMTRTDARGVVTHYGYDQLNRLMGKSYTNDPANTPALTYGYDVEYPWQLTQDENNPVGHLNSIQATVGTTNLVTWTSGDYDQRGNLTGYVTCMGGNPQGCPGFGVGANLGYDLNEDLTTVAGDAGGATYSGQANFIAYGYDSAGRLNSIATDVSLDLSGNSLISTAFSGLTWFPGGELKTASLGIDPTSKVPAVSLVRTFDNRNRITGEVDQSSARQNMYSYSVGYDGVGDVTSFNDSVAGTWTVKNDALHRFSSSSGTYNGKASAFQATYDHFGNRNVEYFTYNGVQNQPSPYLNFTTGNNRASTYTYDNAGNLLSDGTNNYLYDAENRICAVDQLSSGSLIGYVYSPDGTRFGKGTITKTFSCDFTKNGMLTANGLALTTGYNFAPNGDLLEETDGNFNLGHFNVFLQGKLLGTFTGTTFSQSNWSFALNDWLGTKRQIVKSGADTTSYFSGPFGDYQSQAGTGSDPSAQHFTGKERDIESGLDYFPARYYSSNFGRFMSADWAAKPEAVPYSDLQNPQSLNLYGYVKNNPLSQVDKDGHDDDACGCQAVMQAESHLQNQIETFVSNLPAAASAVYHEDLAAAKQVVNDVSNFFSKSETPVPATPQIVVDGSKHPESAQHVADAQAAGKPSEVTIDRGGAKGNRADAMSGIPAVPGQHRDEYPPAVTQEGGSGASVRPISPSDNAGAGASMGNQMRPYADGTKVTITPINVPNPPQT